MPGLRLIATLLAASGRQSDPGASSRKAQDYGDGSPACQLTLTRFRGGGLRRALAADLGPVIGAEPQKPKADSSGISATSRKTMRKSPTVTRSEPATIAS